MLAHWFYMTQFSIEGLTFITIFRKSEFTINLEKAGDS